MNANETPDEHRFLKRPIAILTAFALVLLFQLFVSLPAMESPGTLMDEGMLLTYPELLAKGSIPHRDYESMYPPGNIWLLSGAYAALGTNIQVERFIGLLYQIALASASVALLSRWNALVGLAGGLLCVLALLPLNLVAFAWIGGIAFAAWSLVAISSSPRIELRAGLAGILAGAALTFRADLAPAILLSLGTYCVLARWQPRQISLLAGSAAVALLPLLIHIATVSPAAFIDNVFVKPVLTCSRARALPLDFSRAYLGQLYTVLLISTGLAILAGWRVHRGRHGGDPSLIAAGALSLGALPQALMRSDVTHLSFVTPLALPLVAAAAFVLFSARSISPILAIASVCLLLPQTTALVKHRLTSRSPASGDVFVLHSGSRIFPVGNALYAKASQDVIARLTELSKPGETLFVGPSDLRFAMGNDLFLYHMLPWLRPGSYYLEMNPLSANRRDSRLAREVADSDWLILCSVWNTIIEPNASQVPGPNEPNEVVSKDFERVFSREPFEIFHRRSATAQTPAAGDGAVPPPPSGNSR